MAFILPFEAAVDADAPRIGGKCASLARMKALWNDRLWRETVTPSVIRVRTLENYTVISNL
jgi:hypothetical protein